MRALILVAVLAAASSCTGELRLRTHTERSDISARDAAPPGRSDATGAADGSSGGTFVLELPLVCVPGEDCAVVYHYDLNPDKGTLADFRCGQRTLDGHAGTSFVLRDVRQLDEGVAVLAAAAGTVVAIDPEGSGTCGAGITIDHGDWRTRYCHLQARSALVELDEHVGRGQQIASVGLTGEVNGVPQLYFELSREGKAIDPFSGLGESSSCDARAQVSSLWNTPTRDALRYEPAVIHYGLTGTPFDPSVEDEIERLRSAIFSGELRANTLRADAEVLLFYVQFVGIEQDDTFRTRLFDPAGKEIHASDWVTLPRDWVLFTHASGLKRGDEPWPLGDYRGELEVKRHTGALGPATFSKIAAVRVVE